MQHGAESPEHARLGLRCGSLVLGWHRPGAALWASLQGAEISVQSGHLALRELCLCIQKHAHVTCLSVCFFMSFEQFHDDVAGDP